MEVVELALCLQVHEGDLKRVTAEARMRSRFITVSAAVKNFDDRFAAMVSALDRKAPVRAYQELKLEQIDSCLRQRSRSLSNAASARKDFYASFVRSRQN